MSALITKPRSLTEFNFYTMFVVWAIPILLGTLVYFSMEAGEISLIPSIVFSVIIAVFFLVVLKQAYYLMYNSPNWVLKSAVVGLSFLMFAMIEIIAILILLGGSEVEVNNRRDYITELRTSITEIEETLGTIEAIKLAAGSAAEHTQKLAECEPSGCISGKTGEGKFVGRAKDLVIEWNSLLNGLGENTGEIRESLNTAQSETVTALSTLNKTDVFATHAARAFIAYEQAQSVLRVLKLNLQGVDLPPVLEYETEHEAGKVLLADNKRIRNEAASLIETIGGRGVDAQIGEAKAQVQPYAQVGIRTVLSEQHDRIPFTVWIFGVALAILSTLSLLFTGFRQDVESSHEEYNANQSTS